MANTITWSSGFPNYYVPPSDKLVAKGTYTKDAGWGLEWFYLEFYNLGPTESGSVSASTFFPTDGTWSGSLLHPSIGDTYQICPSMKLYNPQTHETKFVSGSTQNYLVQLP